MGKGMESPSMLCDMLTADLAVIVPFSMKYSGDVWDDLVPFGQRSKSVIVP